MSVIVPLQAVLEYREELLVRYASARENYLKAKKDLEDINLSLENQGVKNFHQYEGDFDLWLDISRTDYKVYKGAQEDIEDEFSIKQKKYKLIASKI